MSDAFVGEVRAFCGNYAPWGWLICNGIILPASQYPALAEVLGNTYGGDGQSTFGLPNFNGRTVMGTGEGAGLTSRSLSDMVGTTKEVLTAAQMPEHSHAVTGMSKPSPAALTSDPAGNVWAHSTVNIYTKGTPDTKMAASATSEFDGGNGPHNNVQLCTCLSYIICYQQINPVIEYYRGEMRMFAGANLPNGWHLCDGTVLDILEYEDLYKTFGAVFGGDGIDTFAIPDLCGRTPIGVSGEFPLGEPGGVEAVSLTTTETPEHSHRVYAAGQTGTTNVPGEGVLWANGGTLKPYAIISSGADCTLSSAALTTFGGNETHNNMMPSLGMNFMMALTGGAAPED
jgi:microcystin-dependent protein